MNTMCRRAGIAHSFHLSTLCRSYFRARSTGNHQNKKHVTHQPVFRAAGAATARRALAAQQLLRLDVSKRPLRGLRFARSPGPARGGGGTAPSSGCLWGRRLAADQTTEVRLLAGVALTITR